VNITRALKERKMLKNELKRKLKIRRDNFNVIIPKDVTLEDMKKLGEKFEKDREFVSFDSITEKIKNIVKELRELSECILITNINTKVEFNGEKVSLAMLKLMVDDKRSELAQLETINERGIFDRRRRISTTEEEEKEVSQLTDLELESMKKTLELEKNALESLLEFTNANTELIKK